jgi:hypothetical protein
MAGQGGARKGAGRKTKAEELKTSAIATEAIVSRFGSKEAAFKWLIGTGEPSLIKFAFEHAFGKPVDNIKHSGEVATRKLLNIDPLSNDQPDNSTP